MTQARNSLVSFADTPYYHYVSHFLVTPSKILIIAYVCRYVGCEKIQKLRDSILIFGAKR